MLVHAPEYNVHTAILHAFSTVVGVLAYMSY